MGLALHGYINAKDSHNKPIILPGEKAEVVKRIFAELAKGKSQAEVKEGLKKKGITIPKSTFSAILRNRVYVAEIHVKDSSNGFYVKGLHQPLIERTVFDNVQALLPGNYKVQQVSKPGAFQDELHLRGRPLTGSASVQKKRTNSWQVFFLNSK